MGYNTLGSLSAIEIGMEERESMKVEEKSV